MTRAGAALLTAALMLGGRALAADTPPAPGTAPYQDRVIEGLAPDDSPSDAGSTFDPSGPPRLLRLETRLGTQPFGETERTGRSFAFYGLVETDSHGTLSADGTFTPAQASDRGTGTLTLRQRGLPLAGASQANLEAGIVYAPQPSVLRLNSRVALPSAILRGASAEWLSPAQGLELQATRGTPGQLQSQPLGGFATLAGQRSILAAQWQRPASVELSGLSLALQHENAQAVLPSGQTLTPNSLLTSARSTLMALRHQSASGYLQARTVGTQGDTLTPSASGVWVDAQWQRDAIEHGAGAYRLGEGLTWAGLPMASDVAGAYYRAAWRTRQWAADASIDALRSVSGTSRSGGYASASLRHRIARLTSLGGGLAVRSFGSSAWSTWADWRWANVWGAAGLRLDLASAIGSQPATQTLTWDQDWPISPGWTLGSRLSLVRDGALAAEGLAADTRLAAALSLAAPIGSRAQLRGSLDTEQAGPSAGSRYSLNLGGSWRIDPRWTLEGNLTRSRGSALTTTSIDPLAPPVEASLTQRDRSFSAVLRYEMQAGSRSVPLGGKPQEGGGRISGTVFLDANRSGTQEAGETGAPGVTIYLDNRYAVRTDAQGRFEFPLVASGPRTVTVRNETLPLPWAVVDEGQVKVDVRLRESTTLLIPVQRAD